MTRILVATDFSTRSDRALRRAVLIARQCDGAALTLVHVIDDRASQLAQGQRAATYELLERTARSVSTVDMIAATAVIVTGDVVEGILRVSDEVAPHMILMGPHRRQLRDMFAGTKAERIIQRARRSVLVANAVPAADYERTLLAIDFDEASRFAIQSVKGMEFLRRSRMTAIHLFDTPAAGLMRRAMERSDAIAEYTAHEALNAGARFGRFLSAAGLLRVEHLLRLQEGSPGRALALRAQLHDADLLVVGTNQRTGVRRIVLGSVAKDVVTSAKCDVLVIPAVTKPGLPVRPNVRLAA